jgi:hypothetical protein
LVTAITVMITASTAFLFYWAIQPESGPWTPLGRTAAISLGLGTLMQFVALYLALSVDDEQERHYRLTVNWFFIGVVMVALALLIGICAMAAQPDPVDYDTFMQQDWQGRLSTFNTTSPENRAEIVRTHLQRWTDANSTRLSPEQLAYLQDALMFISADVYSFPNSADVAARAKLLESRAVALFTPEDMTQAMTIVGAYIPD